ncbi:hypothetical protein O181_030092 [Austropuccinia psidii MF-1]|uniref:Mitochondrial ATP synthase epsilon chain domain-containing protein n=1 Tax=Austropuccinia psidii MF-1 TaxID=1389203 RepID=A0A9Q3H440_9BASI|nr:hypothetical protein [Austropuccinia psidii MF-1]
MSSWRAHFGFNKHLSIASRATQRALKDDVKATIGARSESNLRYQHWESGKAGEQTWVKPQEAHDSSKTPTSA